ncbi:uncharacterized protein ACLA_034840 [Aspergillus clavatus NRRL 1]|uniref:Uncharacterized protein n=1 Tax=Aspergillus clavatus (strain ATCC 1007 / CBS 513.65 / DSM 816 / NCTC 3887 / NRRL 1 / QM 1276 / 107) TaxID=344612 RepID=A1CJF7_ASPCL|nr:uncharacterized protein ACLA_034840 [Aspergillus clavatus NRRL 1]EAW09281.1 hypothetical protein ACLA_034840 [Aspergillus clavatus NRRL 1]
MAPEDKDPFAINQPALTQSGKPLFPASPNPFQIPHLRSLHCFPGQSSKPHAHDHLPTAPTMQAVPESRQQTFEEIYGPPENFLEIEACPQSANPRHIPQHVHVVRDRVPHQHPRVQAQALGRAPPLLRLRILPRHPRAREHARDHPAAAREGVHEPVQRRCHRASPGGPAAVSADRGRASVVADGE